jgi:hypothetical protein
MGMKADVSNNIQLFGEYIFGIWMKEKIHKIKASA